MPLFTGCSRCWTFCEWTWNNCWTCGCKREAETHHQEVCGLIPAHQMRRCKTSFLLSRSLSLWLIINICWAYCVSIKDRCCTGTAHSFTGKKTLLVNIKGGMVYEQATFYCLLYVAGMYRAVTFFFGKLFLRSSLAKNHAYAYLTDGFVVISMIMHKAPDMECNLSPLAPFCISKLGLR